MIKLLLQLLFININIDNYKCYQFKHRNIFINKHQFSTKLSPGNENEYENKSPRKMSWPFSNFEAPPLLDGVLAGDAGFDPLRIVQSRDNLFLLREAEIKHARIAMLAALGWPASELYHYQISNSIGFANLLSDTDGKAPSVLNGGLDNVYVLFSLGLFFAVGGTLEFEMMRRKKETPISLQNFFDMWREDGWDLPGNYGFDPLKFGDRFCPTDNAKLIMQTVEIFNGRTAMLATVGYVVQEIVTGLPVVKETPAFFRFWS